VSMALFGQVVGPRETLAQPGRPAQAVDGRPTAGEVTVEDLEVYDRPDEGSFVTGLLQQGDRVRVRRRITGGWLAIDPQPGALCWIDQSAIDAAAVTNTQRGAGADRARARQSEPRQASVAVTRAVIRSGHADARMPGPPCGELRRGTIVEQLDRPPLEVGRGSSKRLWIAIVPPPELACYIRGDGIRTLQPPPRARPAESQPAYVPARYSRTDPIKTDLDYLPANYAAQIKSVDELRRSMRLGEPIAQWRTDSLRSRYQSILTSAGGDPAVEDAIRRRLAAVTQDEKAAQAARTIESILAESHRRDSDVAAVKTRVANTSRSHVRAYSAVGYIQPSAEQVSGRKLYLLIGNDGSTIAYLDIPPGLDINPHLAYRVGVRGDPHFNEDLGSRLITVRDVETMDSRQ
jgi:hypothetical protein